MNKEQWVDLLEEGLQNIYQISSCGKIKSKFGGKERILKTCISNSGYEFVSLTNKHKKFYIHRLVAKYFINNALNKKQVNHIDGIKLNNNYDNLEWCTQSENNIHMHRVLGYKVHNVSLTKLEAEQIRELYKKGNISQKKISEMFKVSVMVVNRIINNVQLEYK